MPNPISTNPLGQIRDDVGEKLVENVTEPVKQIAQEPVKILEQILGGTPQTEPTEQGQVGSPQGDPSALGGADLSQRKQADDQFRADRIHQLHLQLHQVRQREEREQYEKSKQEQEVREQQEAKEDEEKEQQEVMQLQRRQDSIQLQRQLQGNMGGSQEQTRKRE